MNRHSVAYERFPFAQLSGLTTNPSDLVLILGQVIAGKQKLKKHCETLSLTVTDGLYHKPILFLCFRRAGPSRLASPGLLRVETSVLPQKSKYLKHLIQDYRVYHSYCELRDCLSIYRYP